MSSGERILFLDNSFKMCHCLSMSVMDKKVMQNEMTIVFNRFTLSPHTYKGKLSNMKNCCSSTLKTLYHTLPAGRTDVVRSCYDQVLSEFLDHHTRNHRCQHLIVKFHKNSQGRIFCDLCDTWSMAIYSIHGRGRVWKRRGGGSERGKGRNS